MRRLLYFALFGGVFSLLWVAFLQDLGPVSKHETHVVIKKANATAVYEYFADFSSSMPALHPLVTEVKFLERRDKYNVYQITDNAWPFQWTMKVFSYPDAEKLSISSTTPSAALSLRLSSLFVMEQVNEDVLVSEQFEMAMPLWYDLLLGKWICNFTTDVHQNLLNNLKEHFETEQ